MLGTSMVITKIQYQELLHGWHGFAWLAAVDDGNVYRC